MKLCSILDRKSDNYIWFIAVDQLEAERVVASKMIMQPTSNYVLYSDDFALRIFDNELSNLDDVNSFNSLEFSTVEFSYIKDEYFKPFMTMNEVVSDED